MAKMKNPKINVDVIPEAVLMPLLQSIPGNAPSAKRQASMKKALLARTGDALKLRAAVGKNAMAANDYLLVRADAGKWITFAPNVAMKVLQDNGTTRSWLARFGPGGRIPAHMQSGDEEAIILEGWCYLDEVRINRGDYHWIGKGARHGNIHSPDGCLIFVRSHSETRRASELTVAR